MPRNDEQDNQLLSIISAQQAMMERMTAAFEKMAENGNPPSVERRDELMGAMTEALARLSESQLQGSKLVADETRRLGRAENLEHHGVSVFNRQGKKGHTKPPLKCVMMVPWFLEWESCTREEVELANLLQPGDYLLKRIDNSKIRLTCTIDYKVDGVTPSRLLITHDTGFNRDNFNLIPTLSDYFRQLLRQTDEDQWPGTRAAAAKVMSDEEEEALIEAGQIFVDYSVAR